MHVYLAGIPGTTGGGAGRRVGKGIKGVLSRELPHVIFSLASPASGRENHLLEASQCTRSGEGRWAVCCLSVTWLLQLKIKEPQRGPPPAPRSLSSSPPHQSSSEPAILSLLQALPLFRHRLWCPVSLGSAGRWGWVSPSSRWGGGGWRRPFHLCLRASRRQ